MTSLIKYKEKDCRKKCQGCGRNIKLNGERICDLKMIDLEGTPVIFKDGWIVNRIKVEKL